MSEPSFVPFEEAFLSVPVGTRKIKESEYDPNGAICVVDQGQNLISGRTARVDLLIDDGPYIVFGDHTRAVKYVDFPFVAGADGVRLFKARADYYPEYLFLFLKSAALPIDGYGRHSKYLPDLKVRKMPICEQITFTAYINAKLAEVETARQTVSDQLRDAAVLKSKALELIFAGISERERIGTVAEVQSGFAFKSDTFKTSGVRLLRNTNILPGRVYWDDQVFLSEEDSKPFNSYKLNDGDVLISLDRPIISSGIKVARVNAADLPALLVQRVGRFLIDPDQLDADYLYAYLQTQMFISAISGHDQSLGVPHISPTQVENAEIPLPDVTTQKKLSKQLNEVTHEWEAIRTAIQSQFDDLSRLPNSILAQAFES